MFYSNHLHRPDTPSDCNRPPHNGPLAGRAPKRNVVSFRAGSKSPTKLATADYKPASAAHFPRRSRVFWNLRWGRVPVRKSFGASGWCHDTSNCCHGISAEL